MPSTDLTYSLEHVIITQPLPTQIMQTTDEASCKDVFCPAPFTDPAELSNICADGATRLTPLELTLAGLYNVMGLAVSFYTQGVGPLVVSTAMTTCLPVVKQHPLCGTYHIPSQNQEGARSYQTVTLNDNGCPVPPWCNQPACGQ